ncbi:hypothetical protein A0J61_05824 [Choanephora cucurbitarum]|uniref:F-box domain-containing protein n=1 Tax=Choanephora cucurbitarum TaxID=101091 RepID=A0A1C7NAJ9_9FUNG|nr:hypothetical protein A0J61_05824 [Choanephora cucurbitarum]
MISTLPTEIIAHISTYLSLQDYHHLVLVNHAYHLIFKAYLYNTLRFRFYHHYERFLTVSRENDSVNHLWLGCIFEEPDPIQAIPIQFPFLNSLYLRVTNECDLYGLPLFHHLQSLTLDIRGGDAGLFDMLASTPHLKHLTIPFVYQPICIEWVDDVHLSCPLLEHLDLEYDVLDMYTHSIPETVLFEKLKSLRLMSSHGAPHHSLWLEYVSKRYPNIQSLKLGSRSKASLRAQPYPAYDGFPSSCPSLVYLEWFNIVPDAQMLQRLSLKQKQHQKITLHSDDPIIRILALPNPPIGLASILHLDIHVPSTYDRTQFLLSLGSACPYLQQLKLSSIYVRHPNHLFLDILFHQLSSLQSLYLEGFQLSIQQAQSGQETVMHSLHKLLIERCDLSDDVFNCLDRQCPNLNEVCLDTAICPEEGYAIKIELPSQHLVKLTLSNVRSRQKDMQRPVQLFRLQQGRQSTWYYMDQYHIDSYSHRITAKSSRRLDDTEIDVLHAHLFQTRTLWLEPEYHSPGYADSLSPCVFDGLDLCKLIEQGYVDLVCHSNQSVYLNDKKIESRLLN